MRTKPLFVVPRRIFFVDLFCVSVLYLLYAFVRDCLYVPCGYLLEKGWPLGSRLWCLTVSLLLFHWYPGSSVALACIDSWSFNPYLLCSTSEIMVRLVPSSMYKPSSNFLTKVVLLLWILFVICASCLSVILPFLLLAALWLPVGKWLTSWLSCV